jgi:hypothetical protein
MMRILTTVQKNRKYKKTARWIKNHPKKIKEYDKKHLKPRAIANAKRRRKLRTQAIIKLGGRCASSNCKWINEDGSRGCTDFRILQFDHVKGGGTKHRKKIGFEALCRQVFKNKRKKFQLLCVNCNWIKAFVKREFKFKYEMRGR